MTPQTFYIPDKDYYDKVTPWIIDGPPTTSGWYDVCPVIKTEIWNYNSTKVTYRYAPNQSVGYVERKYYDAEKDRWSISVFVGDSDIYTAIAIGSIHQTNNFAYPRFAWRGLSQKPD